MTRSSQLPPQLASSNSFSARRNTLDFRRSLPGAGGQPAASSPGEAPPPRHSAHRGSSEFGNSDLFASVSGADDDYEATDHEVDMALQLVGRHYSFHPAGHARDPDYAHSGGGSASGGGGGGSGGGGGGGSHSSRGSGARHSMRLPAEAAMSLRLAEEDDFMQRLQQNRASWKDRSRGSMSHGAGGGGGGTGGTGGGGTGGGSHPHSLSVGSGAGGGGPGGGEGLQNQTHAALEQLRGELKSLSMRSMVGAGPMPGPAAAPFAGGSSASVSFPAAPPFPGLPAHAASHVAAAGGGGGGGGGGAAAGRVSEAHHAQMSPSRLSASVRPDRSGGSGSSGSAGGSGSVAAAASEALEHHALQLGSPQLHAQSE